MTLALKILSTSTHSFKKNYFYYITFPLGTVVSFPPFVLKTVGLSTATSEEKSLLAQMERTGDLGPKEISSDLLILD